MCIVEGPECEKGVEMKVPFGCPGPKLTPELGCKCKRYSVGSVENDLSVHVRLTFATEEGGRVRSD